jgi:hypothetical protein
MAPFFDEGRIDLHLEPALLVLVDRALGWELLPDGRRGHPEPLALLERLLPPA